jgi:PBSX family phage portal protein
MPDTSIPDTSPAPASRKVAARNIVVSEDTGYTRGYESTLKAATISNQLNDPFAHYGAYTVLAANPPLVTALEPLYGFDTLQRIYLESNILRQCVESMEVNADAYGHVLEYIGPEGSEDSDEAQAEKRSLNSLLDFPSPENSLVQSRRRARVDREVLGNCAFEISRDRKGRIVLFDHVPACTVRMTRRDPTPVDTAMLVPSKDGDGTLVKQVIRRYFRRFMQVTPHGDKIYFKEFGDPRSIDPRDGEVRSLPVEDQATEILYISNYTPGSVYGTPRWIGNLPAILGSRESEMVNLNFFRDNAIPAMAVLVSGGALTAESFNKVESYINAVRGARAMNRVMVLEAAADESAGSIDHSQPAPKIDMKPMISERQQEGLFQDYDQKNQGKVRSAFRLPPIYTGRAEDYTRASAFASMLTAESQVFGPERQDFDNMMNEKVLSTYRPRFWRFKSLGPSIAEPDAISKMVTTFGAQGALTPNAVIKIANRMLDLDIQKVTDAWGDYPFQTIQEYVRQGGTIKGMEEFISKLGSEITKDNDLEIQDNAPKPTMVAPPAAGGAKPKPAPVAAKKAIQREMNLILDDMRDMLADMRTFASEDQT